MPLYAKVSSSSHLHLMMFVLSKGQIKQMSTKQELSYDNQRNYRWTRKLIACLTNGGEEHEKQTAYHVFLRLLNTYQRQFIIHNAQ